MERRKYIGQNSFAKTFSAKIIRVDDSAVSGYASFLKFEEVHKPLIINGLKYIDNGYSFVSFLPDNEYWCSHAIYDDNGDIIEWYFDMTSKNAVDEIGKPYYDDLYLDAALWPDGRIVILDEDELKDALDDGKITQEDFDLAYDTLAELKENGILKVTYIEALCAKLKLLFE